MLFCQVYPGKAHKESRPGLLCTRRPARIHIEHSCSSIGWYTFQLYSASGRLPHGKSNNLHPNQCSMMQEPDASIRVKKGSQDALRLEDEDAVL
jgi:hypothetical protein